MLLVGHNVTMVNYFVAIMITTCSPIIGQFSDTMIVESSLKGGYNDSSNSKSLKQFYATFTKTRPLTSLVES